MLGRSCIYISDVMKIWQQLCERNTIKNMVISDTINSKLVQKYSKLQPVLVPSCAFEVEALRMLVS